MKKWALSEEAGGLAAGPLMERRSAGHRDSPPGTWQLRARGVMGGGI